MKRNLIFTGQWLVTALILATGLSSYGCADTASVSEDVAAPLASLTITPGALQPAFFANTTNYAVNAPTSAPSVTVTAVPKDSTAIVTIDGFVTSQRSVTLGGPGSTKTILIAVETLNGLETTYTVTVTKLLSSDNTLSALIVTANAVAHPVDLNTPPPYTVNVATNVTKVDVSATKSDRNAVMAIGSETFPAGTPSGSVLDIPIGAPGSDTPISILVTAQNGVDSTTYTVRVHRAASDDNTLSALSVAPGSLDPSPFDPNQVTYTVSVDNSINSVMISATKSDPQATMSALGSVIAAPGTPSGQVSVQLLGTITEVVITVIAQDMTSQTSYTITVNRAP